MSIELWSLFFTTVLLYLAVFVQQIAKDRIYGVKYALSNRVQIPEGEVSQTVERLSRLVRNHTEGLAIFGVVVFMAAIAGVSNNMTQYAAVVYVCMRSLHFLFYALGITPFRSFAWGIGHLGALPVFVYGLLTSV